MHSPCPLDDSLRSQLRSIGPPRHIVAPGNLHHFRFLDRPSKTLILTDLVENIGDRTELTNWVLKFWWKVVMHMRKEPKPAPEYQIGWSHKQAARRSLERILA